MKNTFYEKQIIINSEYDLSATLTLPEDGKEKHPAILIISGSGPGDLDGNFKKLKVNIYKYLAEYLTSIGFVTLRYDKRGVGTSKGEFNSTGMHDLIFDIQSNVDYLKTQSFVDSEKIILLGHEYTT